MDAIPRGADIQETLRSLNNSSTPSNDAKKVTVQIPFQNHTFEFDFYFGSTTTGFDLMEVIENTTGNCINRDNVVVKTNASDAPLYQTLASFVFENTVMVIFPKLRGGGKRGRGDVGGSANIVTGLNKDDAGKKLQDVIGMTLMRCQAAQGTSPAITQVAGTLLNVENQINDDAFSMETALNTLTVKQLVKMRDVKGHSTRVPDRCQFVSNILFSEDCDNLKELLTQCDLVKQSMVMCVHHSIIHQFADEAGNISWDDFTSLVQRVEHNKVEENAKRAQQPPANGLGS